MAENLSYTRKSNFELLRILAMFGIVLFHHFGSKIPCNFVVLPEGFTFDNYFYDVINNAGGHFDFKTLILDFCYGHFGNGGNLIFMLITGFFLFGREVGFEKRVNTVKKLLFTIVFWGCLLTVINAIFVKFFYPFAGCPSYKPEFNFPNWFSGSNAWYFQAYGVFILIILPILKYFESKIDKKTHRALIAMFAALCFLDYEYYLPNNWVSIELLYFVLCYYVGGYVSRYPLKCSFKKLVFALVSYIVLYFCYEYSWRKQMRKMYLPFEYSYISVMSPYICCLIFAVLVFLIFSKLNFQSKVINEIASAVPGVYIFHFNSISTAFAVANTFWWKDWSLGGYIRFILVDAVLLFILGYMLDKTRQFLLNSFMRKNA